MADDVVHAAEGALGAVEVRENRLPACLYRSVRGGNARRGSMMIETMTTAALFGGD